MKYFNGESLYIIALIIFNLLVSANIHTQMMGRGMMGGSNYDTFQYFDPADKSGFTNQLRLPSGSGIFGILNAESNIQLRVTYQNVEIIPGLKTPLMVYQAEYQGKYYINPIFKVRNGSGFSLTLNNELKEKTIIHWHGIKNDSKNDGLPQYTIGKGESYQYSFSIKNEAGTYWYHPHPHGFTGRQAYLGLASFYIVEDKISEALEKSLDLTFGKTDIPLVLQDKRFDSSGRLVYYPNRMEWFMGYYGDNILVNLTPKPYLETMPRLYRFRLLNGSNARIYRLAFTKGSDRLPFYVIAGDGGFLDKPYQVKDIYISPAERVEILLDLSKEPKGSEIFMKSLAFDSMDDEMGGMGGMMGNMMSYMSGIDLRNGDEFYVLKLIVNGRADNPVKLPEKLTILSQADEKGASVRKIQISQQFMQWFINGYTYDMNLFPIQVKKGTKEIWVINNPSLSMPHPIHIHGFQFRVLERLSSPAQIKINAVDNKGRQAADLGYKDTVLVWPGETVRILIDFSHNYPGNQDYLLHCHILEHEDGGMMLNYRVVDK